MLVGQGNEMPSVLKVNDGPNLSSVIEKFKEPLHEWAADAFIEKVKGRKQRKETSKVSNINPGIISPENVAMPRDSARYYG